MDTKMNFGSKARVNNSNNVFTGAPRHGHGTSNDQQPTTVLGRLDASNLADNSPNDQVNQPDVGTVAADYKALSLTRRSANLDNRTFTESDKFASDKAPVTLDILSSSTEDYADDYAYNLTDIGIYQDYSQNNTITNRTINGLYYHVYNASHSPTSGGANAVNDTVWTDPSHAHWNISNYNTTSYNYSDILNTTEPSGIDTGGEYLSGYTLEHVILASILVTFIMFVIVVGNAMVIAAIALDRNLKSESNWFIASLAVSDLLVGLLIMPFSLANELMGYWYFGQVLCELWLSTDVLLCTASILNLCLISLDRYWSITRAISYVRTRTKKRAIIMVATVWILSMIICFPPLVGWKRPQPEKMGQPLCILSEEIGYVVYSTMGSFYIPCLVMVVVYFKIYIAARSRARKNLKNKKTLKVPANGKSMSTTTTTTTSFSAQGKEVEKDPDDLSSDDEPTPIPYNDNNQTGAESTTDVDVQPNSIKLTATNPNAHFRLIDEKRKLLSEDTDSAAESPRKMRNSQDHKTGKQLQCSEDTDSASDCSFMHNRTGVISSGCDSENMKPLLEDSHFESDSHKESDNNSNTTNNMGKEHPSPSGIVLKCPKVQIVEPSDGEDKNNTKSPKHLKIISDAKRAVMSPRVFRRLSLTLNKKQTANIRQEKEKVLTKIPDDPERHKRKLAKARERRATIVLGIIMATFILCWLPFFSVYLLSSIFNFPVPPIVFAIFFWGGYCNSALNPVIYTVFNRDFRHAFIRLICKKRRYS